LSDPLAISVIIFLFLISGYTVVYMSTRYRLEQVNALVDLVVKIIEGDRDEG